MVCLLLTLCSGTKFFDISAVRYLHLTSPAMISTPTPSIDSFLHIIAVQGHCEITVSLNMHAIKSRHFCFERRLNQRCYLEIHLSAKVVSNPRLPLLGE